MIKLSIITVCYNNKKGLIKTIESVKCQTFRNYEFIIIDGGSTDGTLDVLKQYKSLFSYWVSEKDNGIYHAMNKGIIQAKGDYCLFLNSGDYLVDENVLSNVFSVSSYNEDILYGDIIKLNGKRKRLITYSENLTFLDFYRKEPGIHHQAAFIKCNLFEKYGHYREDVHLIADWIFFFETVVHHNVSTKYLNTIISICDATGISQTYSFLEKKVQRDISLKRKLMESIIPNLVLKDYDNFYRGTSKLNKLKTAIKWRLSSFVSMKQFIQLYKIFK